MNVYKVDRRTRMASTRWMIKLVRDEHGKRRLVICAGWWRVVV